MNEEKQKLYSEMTQQKKHMYKKLVLSIYILFLLDTWCCWFFVCLIVLKRKETNNMNKFQAAKRSFGWQMCRIRSQSGNICASLRIKCGRESPNLLESTRNGYLEFDIH